MTRKNLGRSLSKRIPFNVSKAIFDLADMKRGHGWDKTVEKLEDKNLFPNDKIDLFKKYLEEHTLYGGETVSFFLPST